MGMATDTDVVSQSVYFEPVCLPPRVAVLGRDWRPYSMVCAEAEYSAIARTLGVDREPIREGEEGDGTRRLLMASAVSRAFLELDGARIVFVGERTVFADGDEDLTPILVCLFSDWPEFNASDYDLPRMEQDLWGSKLPAPIDPGTRERCIPRLLHASVATWDLIGDCLHIASALEALGPDSIPFWGPTGPCPALA